MKSKDCHLWKNDGITEVILGKLNTGSLWGTLAYLSLEGSLQRISHLSKLKNNPVRLRCGI